MDAADQNSKTKPPAPTGAQSIQRVISVLRVVAQYNQQGARLSKIAQKADLHPATVHRMLSVLVDEGWVTQDPIAKLYHIGFELYALGTTAQQFSIRDRFHSAIENIAEKTEDTCYFVIRSGYDVVCLDRVVGKFPIQVLTFEMGESRPLGIGAGSLAILSSMPEKSADAIIDANRLRYRNYNNKTAADVKRFVLNSRQIGYGLSDKVVTSETIGVGITVIDRDDNAVAAISVAGIAQRMGEKRQKEIAALIESEIKAVRFFSG